MSIQASNTCETASGALARQLARGALALPARLHRNDDGTISIITVFAVLALVMVLGMVMNVGRQVDGKIRMQNAADAVSYSGGVVLARGMNTLAFTNHLLCEVFAMDAFMREAQAQNSASYVPGILSAWTTVGQTLSKSPFAKFAAVGSAILQKAPMEQQLVTAYSQWAAASSAQALPLFDGILSGELIPQFQRAVVAAYPDLAQQACMAVAAVNGQPDYGRGTMYGALWRTSTSGELVGANEISDRTLPVVDPEQDSLPDLADYVATSQQQRSALAHMYLREWNNVTLSFFNAYATMSQFSRLWSGFTCGYLDQLLNDEYPNTNLLQMISTESSPPQLLHANLTYVGVAYWNKLVDTSPVFNKTPLFQNPAPNSAVNYATARVFVPQARLAWMASGGGGGGTPPLYLGGVPEDIQSIGGSPATPGSGVPGVTTWYVGRQGYAGSPPTNPGSPIRVPGQVPDAIDDWSLLNQNWTVQLVPTVEDALPAILRSQPPTTGSTGDVVLPNLGDALAPDLPSISPH